MPPVLARGAAMSEPPVDAEPRYSVRAEARTGYLRVEMSGTRSTLAASIAGWRDVAALVRQHRPRRVLVISKLTGPLPTPEEQHAAIHATAGEGMRGVRFALVLEDSRNVGKLEHSEMLLRE